MSTALAESARLREETRGSHWREDFPDRDDARCSGHFDVTLGGSGIAVDVHARAAVGRSDGMKPTSYDDLPAALLDELTEAGLDPRAVYDDIVGALEEDLPGGAEDVTSAATIPADARGSADFAAREAGVVAGLGVAAAGLRRRARATRSR